MDLTNEFIDILKLELEKFKPKKAEFVKVFEIHFVSAQLIIRFDMETYRFTHNSHFQEFSLKDYNELVDGWEIKIVRCSKGEQGWGLFSAAKKV